MTVIQKRSIVSTMAAIASSSREMLMTTENIFSGLKVVDLSSFIAGSCVSVGLS